MVFEEVSWVGGVVFVDWGEVGDSIMYGGKDRGSKRARMPQSSVEACDHLSRATKYVSYIPKGRPKALKSVNARNIPAS